MTNIKEVLNNRDSRKELLKSIAGMEMTEENIKKLAGMVVECHNISTEAMVECGNIWKEHPVMDSDDPNYKRSISLQALAARSEMFGESIIDKMEAKLSPEKFDAIITIIDEKNAQNDDAYTLDPETQTFHKPM